MTDMRDDQAPGLADEPIPDEGAGVQGAKAREWLSQLESMIQDVASQAGPIARQVAVKAAELAAVAGEKAGPFAQKAAEVTAGAGQRLAGKAHQVASELRAQQEADTTPDPGAAVAETVVDAAETVSDRADGLADDVRRETGAS